jgi:hypothetical protein
MKLREERGIRDSAAADRGRTARSGTQPAGDLRGARRVARSSSPGGRHLRLPAACGARAAAQAQAATANRRSPYHRPLSPRSRSAATSTALFPQSRIVEQDFSTAWTAGAFGGILTLAAALLLVSRVNRPPQALAAAARQIGQAAIRRR